MGEIAARRRPENRRAQDSIGKTGEHSETSRVNVTTNS